MKSLLLFILIGFLCLDCVEAQDYPYDVTQYPFVDYSKVKLIFNKDSVKFERLYRKIDSMITLGQSKLTVAQIGGSHTQADIFSNRMRYRLQTFHHGLIGSRGLVFPYKMCKSNNPSNYIVKYTGSWTSCRNVEWRKSCELGVSGVSATTTDPNAQIVISMNPKNPIKYDFNTVKVFTPPHFVMYDIVPTEEMGKYEVSRNDEIGCITFSFNKYSTVASFRLEKTDPSQNSFTFYGFSLENDNPGVTYHALGINGASLGSWLRCQHFAKQLAELKPDWITIFLGVNDGNSSKFSPDVFYKNYDNFLAEILKYNPNVVFTLIVPNDYYLLRRRPNPAVELEQQQMLKLVDKYGASLFSLYDVMGGLGTSIVWTQNGLMAYDHVHLTGKGYNFAADLMFNAFLRSYDNYLEKRLKKN